MSAHRRNALPFALATAPLTLAVTFLAVSFSAAARPLNHAQGTSHRAVTQSAQGMPGEQRLDKQALRALRVALPALSLSARAAATSPSAAAGAFDLACPSLDLLLDGFGGFGSSTAGGDARFNAGGASFGTIFESMAFVPGSGFLEGMSLALPQSASAAHRDRDGVTASFTVGPWRYDLHSALEGCAPEVAALRQEWIVTNVGTAPRLLAFTAYLDGDLFARGSEDDDFGARVGDELVLFDEGADRDRVTAFVGLSTEAPSALRTHREVGEFSEQRRRIGRSAFVTNRLMRADGSLADADNDGVTDSGFDASLAIAHDFGMLAVGESRAMIVHVRWGVGSIREVAERVPVVSAGPDRVIECEGREGTLVHLEAAVNADAARIVEWAWAIDGHVIATAPSVDVVLLPGHHVASLEGVDAHGRIAMDEAFIDVLDTLPPVLEIGGSIQLWPPNHRLIRVRLPVQATDACSDAVSLIPVAVISDEADDGLGDGQTDPDAQLAADGSLLLRAERSGSGDGRVYRVVVEARDSSGNLALGEFRVDVPHDAQTPSIDSGALTETAL